MGAATFDTSESAGRAATAGGRALPAQVSSFVGRARELAELKGLLTASRLVTLTGAGGSGKTRLALEAATRIGEQSSDEVAFVDLTPITNGDLIVSTVAAVVGVRGEPRRALLDTVVERLADRHLLLILDNLEQLPDAATVIAELLARCSNLRVLATSRSHLHLRGEREYMVEPLALPGPHDLESLEQLERTEAVALFIERARSVDPRFSLTTENAHAVAAICRRVDGLPLAIELAAARSRILTPNALLGRLDPGLSYLTDGPVDAPARQRTLRDTIAWSYDLLEPADRAALARLSVFVGGFTPGAAEAVAPPGRHGVDPLDVLGRLVDQSLLRVTAPAAGEPRFRLLETIREFALEQLDAAEADGDRESHAAYFATLAETARRQSSGPDHASWLRLITDDLDNVRAALAWTGHRSEGALHVRLAVAISALLIDRGDHREADRWLRSAEAMATDAEPALRAALLHERAVYELLYLGDRRLAQRLFTESMLIYESLGDNGGIAGALLYLADVAADLGDPATAAARLERARSVAHAVSDPLEAARLMGRLAVHAPSAIGRADATLAREAVALGTNVGDRPTIALGSIALGLTAMAAGDPSAAIAAMSEAAQIWGELGDRPQEAWANSCLGIAHLHAGDFERARPLLRYGLAGARDAPRFVGVWAVEGAADWLGGSGRADEATICWTAVDAVRAGSLDRTYPIAPEFFAPSRERDTSALRPREYAAARAAGQAMTLGDALDYAIRALDATRDNGSDRDGARGSRRRGPYDLTNREQEVLELLAAGRTDGEIAEMLFISKKTAAVHVSNIKGKLGASTRVEIVRIAMRTGLVDAEP